MKISKAFDISETITFTGRFGAFTKEEAVKKFINYMGKAIPDSDSLKEISKGIKIKELK